MCDVFKGRKKASERANVRNGSCVRALTLSAKYAVSIHVLMNGIASGNLQRKTYTNLSCVFQVDSKIFSSFRPIDFGGRVKQHVV